MGCTGVILAGGLNRRFAGKEKAFLRFGETCILDRIYAVFQGLFKEILLITNTPLNYTMWDAVIASDILPVRSSLTGIHTGLFYSTNDYTFVCAGDTPFLRKETIQILMNEIDPKWDVILPETADGVEPLCAVYSKRMLATVEHQIKNNRFKILQSFRKRHVKKIPEAVFREKDPELRSFFNINTPEDLSRALDIEKANGPLRSD
jgi:molybdopterin-guanine dinucleotide biosynthesis protein A